MDNTNYILITGATGYIGGLLVREIIARGKDCTLILPVRDRAKAAKMFSGLRENGKITLKIVETPVEDAAISRIDLPVGYIIHCASVTQSAEMLAHPVETADGIVLGTKNILELARRKKIHSMVYLSSMEVYGYVPDIGRPVREDELGVIDITSARSCYPLGKRMAEHYCHIYQQEYGVPVKIARLAQTFGRGVHQEDNRVYMQFARAALEGRDIVLKTEGRSMGNYCAVDDVIRAVFTILYSGADGETYNVVNEANTMPVREMARLVAEDISGGKIAVRVEAADAGQTGYAPDTGLRLSSKKLRELGWLPTKDLSEMYRDLMREMVVS